MRPEEELLLLCARTALDPSDADKINRLVRPDLDWDYLYQTASRHGVAPLLGWNLNAICPQQVPPALLDQLRNVLVWNAQRNLLLARELLAIMKLLDANKIPVLPFKGPLLALAAYGNISLRQISDLDVIVHAHDVVRAIDLLLAAGFQIVYPPRPAQQAWFFRSDECALAQGRLVLDIHCEIASGFLRFDLDRVWQRLVPTALAGTTVRTVCPEDLLLILCVHGAKHVWGRLDWLCSVSELLRATPQMDWAGIFDHANRIGGGRILLLGLCLAEQLLGSKLPDRVFQEIQSDGEVAALAVLIKERLFRATPNNTGILEGASEDELHPRMFKHLGDRARYYVRLLFSPTVSDAVWLPLPHYLAFGYYMLRPFRLLAKWGPRIIGRRAAKRE